jgi:hypothetical protein
MILQKNLKLYRFKNIKPDQHSPKKYQYQLFNNSSLLGVEFSDNEFRMGIVTIDPKTTWMELINSTQDIDTQDMEDIDTFLIPVRITN